MEELLIFIVHSTLIVSPDFRNSWYMTPFWSHQIYSFFPKQFSLAVNSNCILNQIIIICSSENISVFIFSHDPINAKKTFLHAKKKAKLHTLFFAFLFVCCPPHLSFFCPSGSFHGMQCWRSQTVQRQTLTSLPFVVEFVFRLHPKMFAM